LLLLHVPPDVLLLRLLEDPIHALADPVIEAVEPIVTTIVARHPVDNVYVIVAVPVATPVTIPLVNPMVATDVALLLHVPPVVELVNVVVPPEHALAVPDMEAGNALTVTVLVT
jgi:hypothetical protein